MKKICRGKTRFRFYIKICLSTSGCDMDLPRWASINPIEIAAFFDNFHPNNMPQIVRAYFERNMI